MKRSGMRIRSFKTLTNGIHPNPLGFSKCTFGNCLPAREPPKESGVGGMIDGGRGETFPSWVWAKPKVLAGRSTFIWSCPVEKACGKLFVYQFLLIFFANLFKDSAVMNNFGSLDHNGKGLC